MIEREREKEKERERERERGGGKENEDVIVREILTIERKGGRGREK